MDDLGMTLVYDRMNFCPICGHLLVTISEEKHCPQMHGKMKMYGDIRAGIIIMFEPQIGS